MSQFKLDYIFVQTSFIRLTSKSTDSMHVTIHIIVLHYIQLSYFLPAKKMSMTGKYAHNHPYRFSLLIAIGKVDKSHRTACSPMRVTLDGIVTSLEACKLKTAHHLIEIGEMCIVINIRKQWRLYKLLAVHYVGVSNVWPLVHLAICIMHFCSEVLRVVFVCPLSQIPDTSDASIPYRRPPTSRFSCGREPQTRPPQIASPAVGSGATCSRQFTTGNDATAATRVRLTPKNRTTDVASSVPRESTKTAADRRHKPCTLRDMVIEYDLRTTFFKRQ